MQKQMLKQIKKRKEEVDLRNEVDQLIFTVDKTLKELDGKVDSSDVQKAEAARAN